MASTPVSSLDPHERPLVNAAIEGIEALAGGWTHDDRTVLRAVFLALAGGRPVRPGEVTASGMVTADIQRVLVRFGSMMQRDEAGRIVGWSGLTLRPTRHEVRVDDVQLHTWCALDPYFIAPILGKALRVTSRDPVTEAAVEVTIYPDGTYTAPPEVAATLVSRGAEALAADVIANFCDYVHHFPSREVAGRFRPDGAEPVVVGLDALAAAGQALYKAVWKA